ncbi:hypothetical protein E4U55_004893 [Claviceps digitariae]|nr:hypothetical protein E4U55_004893 [Claviceps digitariae]
MPLMQSREPIESKMVCKRGREAVFAHNEVDVKRGCTNGRDGSRRAMMNKLTDGFGQEARTQIASLVWLVRRSRGPWSSGSGVPQHAQQPMQAVSGQQQPSCGGLQQSRPLQCHSWE